MCHTANMALKSNYSAMARWLPRKKKVSDRRKTKYKGTKGYSLKKDLKNNPLAEATIKNQYCIYENQIYGRTEQRLKNLVKKRERSLITEQELHDFITKLPSPEITGKIKLTRRKQKSTTTFMTDQEISELINKPETPSKLKSQVFKEKMKARAQHLNDNMERSLLWFKSLYDFNYKHKDDMYNYPFGIYIPDLINKTFKYIVEVDGSIHETNKQRVIDNKKDIFYYKHGYTVFRINHNDFGMFDRVVEKILKLRQDLNKLD